LPSRLLFSALFGLVLLVPPLVHAEDSTTNKVSFYFAAHEDDWQLFMNPSAFEDVAGAAGKTVFVHVTAGDDGLGAGSCGRKQPYYLARENGAMNAIRFMADEDKAPIAGSTTAINFNGHAVLRVGYLNTIAYFLRLPDGNASGAGFAGTGFQSLKRFADGDIETLTAVDGSTVYRSWSDLVATMRDIINYERGNVALLQVNVAETDQHINPQDHSDHLMTAKAALDATKGMSCVRRVYYVDYASAKLPENLGTQERDMESAVFAVTLAGVMAFDHTTAWHHYDQSFIGRNYYRVEEPGRRCRADTAVAADRH